MDWLSQDCQNIYLIFVVVGAIAFLLLGTFIYRASGGSKIGRLAAAACTAGALWNIVLLARCLLHGTEFAPLAAKVYLAMLLAISGIALHFAQALSAKKYPEVLNYVPAAALAVPLLVTDLFVKSEVLHWYTIAGSVGPLGWLLLAYVLLYILWTVAISANTLIVKGGRIENAELLGGILAILPLMFCGFLDVGTRAAGFPFPPISNIFSIPVAAAVFWLSRAHRGAQAKNQKNNTGERQ